MLVEKGVGDLESTTENDVLREGSYPDARKDETGLTGCATQAEINGKNKRNGHRRPY